MESSISKLGLNIHNPMERLNVLDKPSSGSRNTSQAGTTPCITITSNGLIAALKMDTYEHPMMLSLIK
jgi:hypothetical protein